MSEWLGSLSLMLMQECSNHSELHVSLFMLGVLIAWWCRWIACCTLPVKADEGVTFMFFFCFWHSAWSFMWLHIHSILLSHQDYMNHAIWKVAWLARQFHCCMIRLAKRLMFEQIIYSNKTYCPVLRYSCFCWHREWDFARWGVFACLCEIWCKNFIIHKIPGVSGNPTSSLRIYHLFCNIMYCEDFTKILLAWSCINDTFRLS